jgi:hypothetical protein
VIDQDIWLTANQMIKHYGDGAEIETAMRADGMLSQGDLVGRDVWRRVLAAIRELANSVVNGLVH